MTLGPISLCASCARLGPRLDGPGVACAAFPAGIPDEVFVDGFDHRREYPGDGGVRYEQAAGAAAEQALAAYDASRAG